MKHTVTNFGRDGLVIHQYDVGPGYLLEPGGVYTGDVKWIEHGTGRTHYSVRPAERGKMEEDDG